jgi:hypothetical protein
VHVRARFDHCPSDARLVSDAVADAAGRATHIATLLSATVDRQPVAVRITPPESPCTSEQDLAVATIAIEPTSRIVAGTLASLPPPVEQNVEVTFVLHHPSVSGAVTSGATAPPMWVYRSSSNMATMYPEATSAGEAWRQMLLGPSRLLVQIDVTPDDLHNDRALPATLAQTFAADLGINEASYVARMTDRYISTPSGKTVGGLRFVAAIPIRGTASITALTTVLGDAAEHGAASIVGLPSLTGCERDADSLALGAIHAAVDAAHAPAGSEPLAIELLGPYAMNGTCQPGIGYAVSMDAAVPVIPPITLAAHARVSFAAK